MLPESGNLKAANEKSEYDVWKEEFSLKNKGEFDKLVEFVWTITRSSPRDVIQLLNLAKKHAAKKIRIEDIEAAFVQIQKPFSCILTSPEDFDDTIETIWHAWPIAIPATSVTTITAHY